MNEYYIHCSSNLTDKNSNIPDVSINFIIEKFYQSESLAIKLIKRRIRRHQLIPKNSHKLYIVALGTLLQLPNLITVLTYFIVIDDDYSYR